MGCAESKEAKSLAKYTLTVTTNGAYKSSGSRSCVYIDMFGEDSGESTGWIKLDNIMKNDFMRGKKDVFNIQTKDVGVPLIIRLVLRHRTKTDHWACDEVVVSYGEDNVPFPVYDWIEDEISFTRGKALTHGQVNHAGLKNLRARETEIGKAKFQWVLRPSVGDVGWGLPRYVDTHKYEELPRLFRATKAREKNLTQMGFEAVVNVALATIETAFTKLDNLESYTRLYKNLQKDDDPPFINRWQTDVEFGRQQIMGISPTSLQRCTKLPDCCQITHSHVYDILNNGVTLEQEIANFGADGRKIERGGMRLFAVTRIKSQNGKIFIGDYSEVFQGVKRNKNAKGEQLYCPDVIGLFYVNDEQNLIPVAIQLVPNDPESIFTPKDSFEDWLLAKMYFRTAAANLHEWYYHFMLTHSLMEPFSISLFRCLPRSHPVYKLLRPHLQTVSAINDQARKSLIKAGTVANKALAIEGEDLARHMYKTFKMADLVIPEVLKERGLDDRELLPRNYYRDDALTLWVIVEKFVSDVIRHFYSCDEEVSNDEELQEYAKDVALEGLGWHDENTRGMYESISTINELVRLCTIIMYTSSAGHAAFNFPQYQTYKFVPNAPVAMRLPPHRRGEATMERIMNSLPDVRMSTIAITIAYVLSSYSSDEVYLGEYPMRLFTDPEVLEIVENYREELRKFSDTVKQRNKYAGDDAYPWLLPERIPNSVAV